MPSSSGPADEHVTTTRRVVDLDRPLDAPLLAALVELLPDPAIGVDSGGRIRSANQLAVELFGYPPDELVDAELDLLIPERFHAAHHGHFGSYDGTPGVRRMGTGLDLHARRADGSEFPVDISLAPVVTEGGTIVVAAIRDLTERRREQAAQAQLASIVESSNDAIAATTPDGTITSWNPGAERLLGYPAREIVGQSIFVVVAEEYRAPLAAARQRVLAGERVGSFETRRRHSDGTLIDVEVTLSAIVDGEGHLLGVSGVFRDITERRRAEAELARAQRDSEALAMLSDRERIARDLHDHVIQRVFASGMTLQAVARLSDRPEVVERIERVTDELDAVITEIRSTIFGLEEHLHESISLRRQVLQLAQDAGEALGHEPVIRFSGPVDAAVPSHVGEHITAVVREALANVARHAHASATSIELAVGDRIVLTVTDNGIGMGDTTRSSGLRNLRSRADELGGSMIVVPNARGGTTLEWSAPLPP